MSIDSTDQEFARSIANRFRGLPPGGAYLPGTIPEPDITPLPEQPIDWFSIAPFQPNPEETSLTGVVMCRLDELTGNADMIYRLIDSRLRSGIRALGRFAEDTHPGRSRDYYYEQLNAATNNGEVMQTLLRQATVSIVSLAKSRTLRG